MKYESNTKIVRNQAIVDIHENRPGLSYAKIGEMFGITRQRVSKIIIRAKKTEGNL